MRPFPHFEQRPLTVTEITNHLKSIIEIDPITQDTWISGEVSNITRPSSGHLYFTLKDQNAALRCVMWRNSVLRQVNLPKMGDAVEVHGNISIYEPAGQYQLYAEWIRPAGEGALYQEFLRLKAQLEAEGLFDPERKKTIPALPNVIGIVTSPTGAALQDMLNTIRRRFPIVQVILAPTPVQGDDAPKGIAHALLELNTRVKPDVILLARGGGSIEDLWAFNTEVVARAIAASEVPVISGVGHETDFTIADFVADQRAPTPTAASEYATPDKQDLLQHIYIGWERIRSNLQQKIHHLSQETASLEKRLQSRSPEHFIRISRQMLDERARNLDMIIFQTLRLEKNTQISWQHRLNALNPSGVLRRGYSVVRDKDGVVIRSVYQVDTGDPILVTVTDGDFGAEVIDGPVSTDLD